jgi:hypothetical protein
MHNRRLSMSLVFTGDNALGALFLYVYAKKIYTPHFLFVLICFRDKPFYLMALEHYFKHGIKCRKKRYWLMSLEEISDFFLHCRNSARQS